MKIFQKSEDRQMLSDWAGFLSEYGITESNTSADKYKFLAEMAHNQAMFDNTYLTEATTTPGMFFQQPGSISAMGAPIAPTPFQTPYNGVVKTTVANSGSGDRFPSLLPISIQAAAKTIAFDLVSTINMDSPVGFIPYLDYVYQGGNVDTDFAPFTITINGINANTIIATATGVTFGTAISTGAISKNQRFIVYNTATTPVEQLDLRFVGWSRIDGNAIFRVNDISATTINAALGDGYSIQAVTDTPINVAGVPVAGYAITVDADIHKAQLTSALENHISGFTTSNETHPWVGNYTPDPDPTTDAINLPLSMNRAEGEKAQYRQMGIKMFTKFVEAETDQVGLSATVEQIQDFNRVMNFDAIKMLENLGINELAQTMSKKITARITELGSVHTANINRVEGANVASINLGAVAGGTFDNVSTLQRRLGTKLAEMSNLIYHRSRWGSGEYVVTNGRVAAALADISNYSISPFNIKAPATGGQLFPSCEVYGMKVYVDPNAKWGDSKIVIGRRGKDEEPGIKFMPYIMAETIQTTSESTGSPKLFIKSRYKVVDAGWHPETQYITLNVSGLQNVVASV
jgi:hypothetical protein